MWSLLWIVLEIFCLLPRDSRTAKQVDEAIGRGLERVRWLIYGVILLGVLMLAVAGVALLLTP